LILEYQYHLMIEHIF